MTHICEQLVEAVRYLETKGMSKREFASLHHFSLSGRDNSFRATYRYFGIDRNLRKNNIDFAERCKFIAHELRNHKASNFKSIVAEALAKWPLPAV